MTDPKTPKPIKITVSDADGALLSGARVYAYNSNNYEFSNEKGTTNSSGVTIMDMANFPNGYTTGDVINFLVQETATSHIDGQDVVDKLARELIKNIKANIKSYSGTKNVLFYNGLLANSKEPYDEANKLFKRRVELNFKAINIGEI